MGNSFTVKVIIDFSVHTFNLEFPKVWAVRLKVKNPPWGRVVRFLSRIWEGQGCSDCDFHTKPSIACMKIKCVKIRRVWVFGIN